MLPSAAPAVTLRARAPAAVAGNATGAGDAVAAALAHGLVLGRPWDERLRHAAALGAATAAAPVAGEFRHQDYLGALTATAMEEVPADSAGKWVSSSARPGSGRVMGAFNVIGIEHGEEIVTGPRRPTPVVLRIARTAPPGTAR